MSGARRHPVVRRPGRGPRGTAVLPVLLGLGLLAAASRPALAGEGDAGLRSVFALGAGNRALAMGGAYGAVAEGPLGATWNPAGLARQQRLAFTAGHSSLFGLGFGEQCLGVAWPHWRRGTFGLTVRRFGTDGIERRDDRNVLLDDDLSDSELEIGLGHGRSLRPGLEVGALLKLQSQSLAGYSAGGVGLDVGVLVAPLRLRDPEAAGGDAWTVGLAVRNLLEPKLRLDLEAVPDPRAWRLGTAYRRRLGTDLVGLAAVDVEQTRGMAARGHAGVELRYRDLAALRLGTLHGNLTAGFGAAWRDYRVDVAFEDNPLGSITRFGVTVRRGVSVAEQRRTALRRREEERRRALEAAFRESQRRQLAELLDQAAAARDAGDYEEAAVKLAMAQVLAPDDPRIPGLQVSVLREQARSAAARGDEATAAVTWRRLLQVAPGDSQATAALAALRSQGERRSRRSASVRRHLDRALDAFARDDFTAARKELQAILAVQPDDSLAASLLGRVQEAAGLRAAELGRQALSLVRAGDLAGAAAVLERAAVLRADDPVVQRARRELARRRAETARRAAARTSPPATTPPDTGTAASPAAGGKASGTRDAAPAPRRLTPEQRREVARQYRQGLEAAAAGRHDLAVKHWELAWSLDPDHADLRRRLLDEYLTRGMEAFAAGRLEEAVAAWRQAQRVDPQDRRARSYLERAERQLARIRSLTGR